MTCREFLNALQDNPDAELIFEKMMEPDNGNGRLCQQLGNLDIWCSTNTVRIVCDPFNHN
jgi:hypothetical protein